MLWHLAVVAVAAGIYLAVVTYKLWTSTLVRRVRLDRRGIIFTVGKSLQNRIPWDDLKSVRCYERQGGFTMSEKIRGIEYKAKSQTRAFIGMKDNSFKMESDVYGQESLDKTVRVIQFYHEKYDFKAKVDKWESGDKYLFAREDSDS